MSSISSYLQQNIPSSTKSIWEIFQQGLFVSPFKKENQTPLLVRASIDLHDEIAATPHGDAAVTRTVILLVRPFLQSHWRTRIITHDLILLDAEERLADFIHDK